MTDPDPTDSPDGDQQWQTDGQTMTDRPMVLDRQPNQTMDSERWTTQWPMKIEWPRRQPRQSQWWGQWWPKADKEGRPRRTEPRQWANDKVIEDRKKEKQLTQTQWPRLSQTQPRRTQTQADQPDPAQTGGPIDPAQTGSPARRTQWWPNWLTQLANWQLWCGIIDDKIERTLMTNESQLLLLNESQPSQARPVDDNGQLTQLNQWKPNWLLKLLTNYWMTIDDGQWRTDGQTKMTKPTQLWMTNDRQLVTARRIEG